MKKLIFLIIIIASSFGWAQNDQGKHKNRFSEKFEELEKIKLLEVLDLDEETTLKFFARRNGTKNNIKNLMEKGKENYDKLETEVLDDNGYSNFDDLIARKYEIEKKIIDEKAKFINSLGDILTKSQILKYVLFERKFKSDVRDLLIEKGRRKFKKERFEK